jgi:tetratricopeptide (TPR) repeat protein
MMEKHPSPIEKWQADFEQQPLEALDRLLTRRAYMGHLNENDTDEILFRLFHTATDDSRMALDRAMRSWFMKYLEVAPPSIETVQWIEILQNAFSTVIRVDLREAQEWLRENRVQARLWMRSLYLDPARDPEADLLRMLALCQCNSELLPLWMRLCRLEEDRPLHFASIGLLGLCKLPNEDGRPHGDLHQAVFSGIVELANAISRQTRTTKEGHRFWLLEVRALMARYPRGPKYWAEYFLPLVLSEPTSTAAKWLSTLIPQIDKELGRHRQRGTSIRHKHPVSWFEYGAILDLLVKQPLEKVRPRLEQFLDRHRIYAHQTGYAEDLVKTFSDVGYKIYKQDVNWALTLIEEAFHWAPYDPYLWTERATLESYLNRNMRAIGILWEAKRIFPESAHTRTILANLLAKEGEIDIAEMVYRQAIEDFPENVVCRTGLAQVLRVQGRLNDAERVYRQAIQDFPNKKNAYCYCGLAEVLKEQGTLAKEEQDLPRVQDKLDEAEGVYRQAVEYFKKDVVCRNGLAQVLRVQKKLPEAEIVYRQAMTDFPDDPVSRIGLAIVLLRKGNREDAVSLLEETVKKFPQNPTVEAFLQKIKEGTVDTDAIEVMYEEFNAALAEAERAALFGKIPIEKEIETPYEEPRAALTEAERAALFGKIPIEKEIETPYEEPRAALTEADKIPSAHEAFIETGPKPITTSPLRGVEDTSETEIGLANLYRLAARRAIGEEQMRYRQESVRACKKALSNDPNNIFALLERGFELLDQEPQAAATFFDKQVTDIKRSNVLGFRIGNLLAKMQVGEAITAEQWRELMNEFRSRRTIIALERARLELHCTHNGDTLSIVESLRKQLRTDIKTLPRSLWENEIWVRSAVTQKLFAKIDLEQPLKEDVLPQLHDNCGENNLILQGVTEQSLCSNI